MEWAFVHVCVCLSNRVCGRVPLRVTITIKHTFVHEHTKRTHVRVHVQVRTPGHARVHLHPYTLTPIHPYTHKPAPTRFALLTHQAIIRLWDTLLSEEQGGSGFEDFHVYVCAAFLKHFSDSIQVSQHSMNQHRHPAATRRARPHVMQHTYNERQCLSLRITHTRIRNKPRRP